MFINTALAASDGSEIIKALYDVKIIGDVSISGIFPWAFGIGGGAALGIFMYAGVLYIVSAGNPSRQKDSVTWIKAAVYGLLLLATGWIILNVINPAILK
jgi:uncharacterized membrane protein YqgA involved in biofilm formation